MFDIQEIKKHIRVVGFDLDQTLYPKSKEIDGAIQAYLYQKIAEHKNVSVEEAGKMFRDLYKEGTGLSGNETLQHLGLPNASDTVQEAIERADIAKFLHPNEKVLEVLQAIKQKFGTVDLVTGSIERIAREKLSKLGIPVSLFTNMIFGDTGSKSSGEAYKLWLSLYKDFKPEEFLYIGDRPRSDFDVPSTFGIRSILVNQSKQKPEVDCLQLPDITDLAKVLF